MPHSEKGSALIFVLFGTLILCFMIGIGLLIMQHPDLRQNKALVSEKSNLVTNSTQALKESAPPIDPHSPNVSQVTPKPSARPDPVFPQGPDIEGPLNYQNTEDGYSIKIPAGVILSHDAFKAMSTGTMATGVIISPNQNKQDQNWYEVMIHVRDTGGEQTEDKYLDQFIEYLKKACKPTDNCSDPVEMNNSRQIYEKGEVKGLLYHSNGHPEAYVVIQIRGTNIYTYYVTGASHAPNNWMEILDSYLSTVHYN